jgi:YqaJ-like viral recombinase domain
VKIYRDLAQGSAEWFALRKGIPTASCFDQIITPSTEKFSKQSAKYAYRLLAERLLGEPMESVSDVEWMERGRDMEPLAVKHYEWMTDLATEPVGFITDDDGLLGCSPDRLVKGRAIAVEIKCPAPWNHLRYMLEGPGPDYRPQVQGQLYVAELEQVHLFSYHPRMPATSATTVRDEPYIVKLRDALDQFLTMLARMEERAKAVGVFQAIASAATPVEVERAGELRSELLDREGIPP